MPFHNILPLYVSWQEGIDAEMLLGVFSGIARTLLLADVFQDFPIRLLGQRRQSDWLIHKNSAELYFTEHQSIDWDIWWAGNAANSVKPGYLNSTVFLDSLRDNPNYSDDARYDLAILREPIYLKDDPAQPIIGLARTNESAVISIRNQIRSLNPVVGEKAEDKKRRWFDFFINTQMLTMHELGHIFGLFPGTTHTSTTVSERKAAHCPNDCVMYWEVGGNRGEKIKDKPFCDSCLANLKNFFIAP